MSEQMIMSATGYGGTIEVYGTKIRMVYKNSLLMLPIRGRWAPKDIFIRNISSIQFKEAGLVAGFIQFSLSGSHDKRGGGIIMGGATQAQKDENSMVFYKNEMAEFIKVRDYLNEKIASMSTHAATNVVQQISAADEIAKLAQLKAQGIITDEEFTAKKKQLLGL